MFHVEHPCVRCSAALTCGFVSELGRIGVLSGAWSLSATSSNRWVHPGPVPGYREVVELGAGLSDDGADRAELDGEPGP